MSQSSAEEVRQACAAAAVAARTLAQLDAPSRAVILRDVAAALLAASEDIVRVADEETHLGPARLANELVRTSGQMSLFATVVEDGTHLEAMLDSSTSSRPDVRRVLRPIGPVAVFAASNFPLAFSVAGGDTASALAAGCPVVVKAHEGHPRLSRLVADVLCDVLPAGALNVVYGRDAGRALIVDEAIAAVGFTGSTAGGRALFDLAQGRPDPIPFYGELGSINPVIVSAAAVRARGETIARDFVNSFTLGRGQFCTKPGLLFLPAGHGLEVPLCESVWAVPDGELLGDWIVEAFEQGLAELRAQPMVREFAVGAATLLTVPAHDFHRELADECFGPVSLIVEYTSIAELFSALDNVPGTLTLTIHGELPEDAELAADLVRRGEQQAGRVIWNGWPTGVSVTWAMHHGGPWPATTSPLHSSVGATAIRRFLRPVAYQDVPDELLPVELRDANPARVPRRVDGGAAAR